MFRKNAKKPPQATKLPSELKKTRGYSKWRCKYSPILIVIENQKWSVGKFFITTDELCVNETN